MGVIARGYDRCDDYDESQSWIDPSGKRYDLEGSSHSDFAFDWVDRHPVSKADETRARAAARKMEGKSMESSVWPAFALAQQGWLRVVNAWVVVSWETSLIKPVTWATHAKGMMEGCLSQIGDPEKAKIELNELAFNKVNPVPLAKFLKDYAGRDLEKQFWEALAVKTASKRIARDYDLCGRSDVSQSWIDPSGKRYDLLGKYHSDFAQDWVDRHPVPYVIEGQAKRYNEEQWAYYALLRMGWLRVINAWCVLAWDADRISPAAWETHVDGMMGCLAHADPETARLEVSSVKQDTRKTVLLPAFLKQYAGERVEKKFWTDLATSKVARGPYNQCKNGQSQAWIDPDGKRYDLHGLFHSHFALFWVKKHPVSAEFEETCREAYRERHPWVKDKYEEDREWSYFALLLMGWVRVVNAWAVVTWESDKIKPEAWQEHVRGMLGCASELKDPEEQKIGVFSQHGTSKYIPLPKFIFEYAGRTSERMFWNALATKRASVGKELKMSISRQARTLGDCDPYRVSMAWITPSGRTYTGIGDHSEWSLEYIKTHPVPEHILVEARALNDKLYQMDETLGIAALVRLGWVRVSNYHSIMFWKESEVRPSAWKAYFDLLLSCTVDIKNPEREIVSFTEASTNHYKDDSFADFIAKHADRAFEKKFYNAIAEKVARAKSARRVAHLAYQAPQRQTYNYEIEMTDEVASKFHDMLSYMDWSAGVGHGAQVSMFVDGDGADVFRVKSGLTESKDLDKAMDVLCGIGAGLEIALGNGEFQGREVDYDKGFYRATADGSEKVNPQDP